MIKGHCIHKFGSRKNWVLKSTSSNYSVCATIAYHLAIQSVYSFFLSYRHEEMYMKWYLTRSTCSNELFTCLRDIAMLNVNDDDDDEEENYLHGMNILLNIFFLPRCLMWCVV